MNNTAGNFFGSKVDISELGNSTQGDIIYFGASGVPAALAAGTAGQFLKTQGAGANPVWAGSGSLTFLGKTTLGSSGATISVSGLSTAAYKFLIVKAFCKGNSATNGNVTMRFNNDSGNNYRYSSSIDGAGASGASAQNAFSWGFWDNTEECCLHLDVTNVATRRKLVCGQGIHGNDGNIQMDEHLGVWSNATDNITQVDLFSADAFDTGSTLMVFGVTDS